MASGRRCCLCHRYRGTKIECHHIIEEADGGDNTRDNCIPVCFDCHADMRSYDFKHPKGTKFTPSELKTHRDAWYRKIAASGGLLTTPEQRDVDRVVFERLRTLLPWNGPIAWLNRRNFAGFSFPLDALRPFDEFLHSSPDPSSSFLDAELESLRGDLAAAVDRFSLAIATWTFPTHQSGVNSVPPEWEETSPDSFHKAVAEIHESANEVVANYSALIQECRRRLAVP